MDVNGGIYKVLNYITPKVFVARSCFDQKEYKLSVNFTKVIAKSSPNSIQHPSLFDTIALPEVPWLLDVVYWVVDVDSSFEYAISNGRDKKFGIDSKSIIDLAVDVTINLTEEDILLVLQQFA
ncbi:MAG: hypothetical protein NZZ41_02535 [Candidatus Dojkabacteria bacterium]|nr:hypothetical protein [Candidatus Dojkabacteria bacterium]